MVNELSITPTMYAHRQKRKALLNRVINQIELGGDNSKSCRERTLDKHIECGGNVSIDV